MRIAFNDEELIESFRLSQSESLNAFNDSRMLVEKYIESPRHIEIQIIGDKHGNVVYLPERECSIQRRNQKVIEESPSCFIDSQMRAEMGRQAVALAKAVGYDSVGTCEFLVDKNRKFYFLEMNTRLQVEHPVTELITDLDLVAEMIKIAKGEPLSFTQEDIKINGWAIESRIYAENPGTFMPSVGQITRYMEPTGEGIRCDSGVVQGSEISIHFDPLLCKLCTHAPTRQAAIKKMKHSLDSFVIQGVVHNIPLLRDIYETDQFISGKLDTNFIPQVYPHTFQGHQLSHLEASQLLSVSAFVYQTIENWKCPTDVKSRQLYISIDGKEPHKISLSKNQETTRVSAFNKTFFGPSIIDLESDWKLGDKLLKAMISNTTREKIPGMCTTKSNTVTETHILQYHPLQRGFQIVFLGTSVFRFN